MKITKSQLKQIIREELLAEFWGRKSKDPEDVAAKIKKEREKLSKKEKELKSKTDPGKSKEIKLPSTQKTAARQSAEKRLAALKKGPLNELKTVPSRWWEYEPKDVVTDIYHQRRQLPPKDWEHHWPKIKEQLKELYGEGPTK